VAVAATAAGGYWIVVEEIEEVLNVEVIW